MRMLLIVPFVIAIFVALIYLIGAMSFFTILEKQILFALSFTVLCVIIFFAVEQ